MERESGYYWIILLNNKDFEDDAPYTINGWEVAFYDATEHGWYSIWDGGAYKDDEVYKINENKLMPEL